MRLIWQKNSKENVLLNLLERDEALSVQKSFSVHNSIHSISYRFQFFIKLQQKLEFFQLYFLFHSQMKCYHLIHRDKINTILFCIMGMYSKALSSIWSSKTTFGPDLLSLARGGQKLFLNGGFQDISSGVALQHWG